MQYLLVLAHPDGAQIPAGAWHTIHVIEPSVIFEAKDGGYRIIEN